ncbi:hypothetical protein [uncultured Anaerococcus sp.]|uniref:hypothetical protein n=1 Tax=uncultured Anaerococcus sp. TaxID=293428 RepID=UPI0028057515|nr:hypothetical protein [uncultured Anaerococcus sp.]
MKNVLCFNYLDNKTEEPHNFPGGRDNYIYIIFELMSDYIDNPDKKVYMPYDGFMRPLDKFSSWDKNFRKKVIRHCEERLSGISGEVWIDDVRIK